MKTNSDYDNFKLIRPLPNCFKRTKDGIPILKKQDLSKIDFNNIKFTSFSNINSVKDKSNTCVLFFQHDKTIDRVWNDPFKYIGKFSGFCLLTTPDYSRYANMDRPTILNNVYRTNWLGCFYQSNGFVVINTVSWAKPDTFDLCFDSIEKGSIVCVSTIGCQNCKEDFLIGFNEMKKRINPPLILVKGKLIKGMVGKFRIIEFTETFNLEEKYMQLKFLELPKIIEIKGGDNYGW